MAEIRNLPTYVALQATHGVAPFKYMGVIDDGSEYQDYVAYSTSKVVSQQAKFAVEFTTNGNAHIRSCYNNKYWVRYVYVHLLLCLPFFSSISCTP